MNVKPQLNCPVGNGTHSRILAPLLATVLALASAVPSAAWQVESGGWVITDNLLQGSGTLLQGSGATQTYSYAYLSGDWTDYTVEGRVQFTTGAYGGGLGGRLDPLTGAHYAAWIYPEESSGGSNVLKLVKFQTWTNWGYNGVSYAPIQTVGLAGVGTGSHTLRLAFHSSQIAVYLDGSQVMSVADAEPEPYLSGGISADMWTDSATYTMSLNGVMPSPLVVTDSFSVNANTTLAVAAPGLLGNDTGVYGNNLTAVLVSGPTNGTLTLNPDGGFAYAPGTNFAGGDSFVYQANDGQTSLGTATVTLTVNPAVLTVAGMAASNKIYDGTTSATLSFANAALVGVASGDNVTLDTASAVGAFADPGAGTGKVVTVSGLALVGADAGKYVLSADTATATADITPLSITVNADPKTKAFGAPDPIFTYHVTNGSLLGGDSFFGSLARSSGESVGTYAILQYNLSAGGNYAITFVSANLTITTGNSSLALVSSLNPAAPGTAVTIMANLSPTAPNGLRPTGSVQFYLNDAAYGSPIAIVAGGAGFSTSDLPVGTNVLLAAYPGDSNCAGSTNRLVQIVDPGALRPAVVGMSVSKTGTVTVSFLGTPGSNYVVQASAGLHPPVWQDISTNTAAADGHWTFTEALAGTPQRYYRATTP